MDNCQIFPYWDNIGVFTEIVPIRIILGKCASIVPIGKVGLNMLQSLPPRAVYSSEDIGRIIRNRRKELGYTQTELAEFNRCSLRFISELERGKEGASLSRVIRVAHSLGLDFFLLERGGAS